jgi:hypothetical protein
VEQKSVEAKFSYETDTLQKAVMASAGMIVKAVNERPHYAPIDYIMIEKKGNVTNKTRLK